MNSAITNAARRDVWASNIKNMELVLPVSPDSPREGPAQAKSGFGDRVYTTLSLAGQGRWDKVRYSLADIKRFKNKRTSEASEKGAYNDFFDALDEDAQRSTASSYSGGSGGSREQASAPQVAHIRSLNSYSFISLHDAAPATIIADAGAADADDFSEDLNTMTATEDALGAILEHFAESTSTGSTSLSEPKVPRKGASFGGVYRGMACAPSKRDDLKHSLSFDIARLG